MHDTRMPALAVLDRQPLGERDSGVLGDAVGQRGDLRQQAGGGRRVDQISLAALEHLRQQRARSPDVRHHVDAPRFLPRGVGRLRAAAFAGHAGVRDEDVDRAVRVDRLRDQLVDAVLATRVELDRESADLLGDGLRFREVAIGDDHGARALRVETARERAADPAAAARHDDVPSGKPHGGVLYGRDGRRGGSGLRADSRGASARRAAVGRAALRRRARTACCRRAARSSRWSSGAPTHRRCWRSPASWPATPRWASCAIGSPPRSSRGDERHARNVGCAERDRRAPARAARAARRGRRRAVVLIGQSRGGALRPRARRAPRPTACAGLAMLGSPVATASPSRRRCCAPCAGSRCSATSGSRGCSRARCQRRRVLRGVPG